jgi:hypothetical protein
MSRSRVNAALAGPIAEVLGLDRRLAAALGDLAATDPSDLTQACHRARLAADDVARALDRLYAAASEADMAAWEAAWWAGS